MLFTVADARNFVAPWVEAGSKPNRTLVLDRINEAIRRLLVKADWPATIRQMRIWTTGNILTMPREVERVIAVTTDLFPARVFGMMYQFLEGGPGELPANGGVAPDIMEVGDGFPSFFGIPFVRYASDGTTVLDDTGPSKLIAFATELEDVGQVLTLGGLDTYDADILVNGMPNNVQLPIGRWKDGVEGSIDFGSLPPFTPQRFKELTSVRKPVTKGYVNLYTWNETSKRMYFLSKYHPEETQPGYHRYRLLSPLFTSARNVLCLVKLRYVPAIHDTEVLLIQNLDALKLMIMAIREENARNLDIAAGFEASAYRLLNEQHLNNATPGLNIQIQDTFAVGGQPNVI